MIWTALQREVIEWSTKNFGNRSTLQPFLGLVEEFTELCQALDLRDEKGIDDALGDFFIYLADYTGMRGLDMNRICSNILWSSTPYNSVQVHCLEIFRFLGEASHPALKWEQGIRINEDHKNNLEILLRKTVQVLCKLVRKNSEDLFVKCISPTWEEVKQRDWKSNPVDGVVSETT